MRQGPTWFRGQGAVAGRDGCRVPIPWSADAPAYGFSPTGRSWLPQPHSFARYAADRQVGVPGSTLELYRTLLRLRREPGLGARSLSWVEGCGPDVLAFEVAGPGGAVRVVANLGEQPVHPGSGEFLAASGDLDPDGRVPTGTSVWLRVR